MESRSCFHSTYKTYQKPHWTQTFYLIMRYEQISKIILAKLKCLTKPENRDMKGLPPFLGHHTGHIIWQHQNRVTKSHDANGGYPKEWYQRRPLGVYPIPQLLVQIESLIGGILLMFIWGGPPILDKPQMVRRTEYITFKPSKKSQNARKKSMHFWRGWSIESRHTLPSKKATANHFPGFRLQWRSGNMVIMILWCHHPCKSTLQGTIIYPTLGKGKSSTQVYLWEGIC